ncbi:hypothetical protein P3T76_002176 [Phytophthora citrophthora]|uniref:TKL protein kinase n=1 Tax=Phytophthora citrophthora TaxID=4793 RepID=A0AAD9GXX5_9STRA|nr:hypothetical protein P3T76_002176 [Phytophthora citrophthora]
MQFTIHPRVVPVAVLTVIAALVQSVLVESFASTIIYSGHECSGTPLVVSIVNYVDCKAVECAPLIDDGRTYSFATNCESTDRQTYVADTFEASSYVMIETFTIKCQLFLGAMAFLAKGECQVYNEQADNYVIAKVEDDGLASIGIYKDSSCTGDPFLSYEPKNETIATHSCYRGNNIFYISEANTPGQISTTSTSRSASDTVNSTASNSSSGDFVGDGSTDSRLPSSEQVGSQLDENETVSLSPSEGSGGISTGAIVGILVAYVILCVAASILCMDWIERLFHRLFGLTQ